MTISENTRDTIRTREESPPVDIGSSVRKHVQEGDIGMLTTMNEEGFLHSRPMGVHKVTVDGVVYFFSRDPSFKTEDVCESARVNLCFLSVAQMRFASLCGTAEVSRDPRLLAALWDESLREWFPQGLKDPSLAVLIVSPECFDIWDHMMHSHAERIS